MSSVWVCSARRRYSSGAAQSRAKQIYRLTLGDGVHQSLGQSLRGVDRGTKVSMNAMASQGGFGSFANGGKAAGMEPPQVDMLLIETAEEAVHAVLAGEYHPAGSTVAQGVEVKRAGQLLQL